MNLIEYADREMLSMNLANVLAGSLRKALHIHEFASFAVPGGTTPGPVFDMLNGTDLDWSNVHILLTDERWVAEDDERSNARLIRERLLVDRAAQARFTPFYQADQSAAEGCAAQSDALAPLLPLSVVLLGMGADMHTASLFPGAEGLEAAMASDAEILCPVQPDGQDIARVTLSARVLDDAMDKHLVIYGAEKRAALERAEGMARLEAPIAAVLEDITVHWAE